MGWVLLYMGRHLAGRMGGGIIHWFVDSAAMNRRVFGIFSGTCLATGGVFLAIEALKGPPSIARLVAALCIAFGVTVVLCAGDGR